VRSPLRSVVPTFRRGKSFSFYYFGAKENADRDDTVPIISARPAYPQATMGTVFQVEVENPLNDIMWSRSVRKINRKQLNLMRERKAI